MSRPWPRHARRGCPRRGSSLKRRRCCAPRPERFPCQPVTTTSGHTFVRGRPWVLLPLRRPLSLDGRSPSSRPWPKPRRSWSWTATGTGSGVECKHLSRVSNPCRVCDFSVDTPLDLVSSLEALDLLDRLPHEGRSGIHLLSPCLGHRGSPIAPRSSPRRSEPG